MGQFTVSVSREDAAKARRAAAEVRELELGTERRAQVRSEIEHFGGSSQRDELKFKSTMKHARVRASNMDEHDPPAAIRAALTDKDGMEFVRVEGYASVVEVTYEMWDFFGPYGETIKAGAFDKTLEAKPAVVFRENHRSRIMARTGNGTLELSADDHGLKDIGWLNPTRSDINDLVIALDDGHVTEQSFMFRIPDGGGWWSDDFMEFEIREIDLDRGDVGPVTYGANPYTDIAARSRSILDELEFLPAGAAREALSRLVKRDDLGGQMIIVDRLDLPVLSTRHAARDANMPQQGRTVSTIEAMLAVEEAD